MLATVILDTYTLEESKFLADALEEVASASDSYGWSSSGIYCFWNPLTKKILYIGLAVDLPNRFRQHNGLIGYPADCCKREKIAEYFKSNPSLGFSIMVQSNLSQAITSRWESANPDILDSICRRYEFFDREEAKKLWNIDVDSEIRTYEGALILAFEKIYGCIPPWNKIRGADIRFDDKHLQTASHLLKSFTGSHDSLDPLSAHVRLRELSLTPKYQGYEELLHSERLLMLMGFPQEDALRNQEYLIGYHEEMGVEGYNAKQVII